MNEVVREDRNCLSYWFPRLKLAGLPVPRTILVEAPDLRGILDGLWDDASKQFLERLQGAGAALGYPVFLRTGHGSGKHQWRDTCFVTEPGRMSHHVYNLCEWSEMVSILGLPYRLWAVREMLPTTPYWHVYEGMPVNREFRYFVRDGNVVCSHPYWPKDALTRGFPLVEGSDCFGEEEERQIPADFDERYKQLCSLSLYEVGHLRYLATQAALALGDGGWSVDLLETTRGWYVTDCAVAEESYHWPACPKADLFTRRPA